MSANMERLKLGLFVDTAFADLFASEDKMEPISVKSWTGILLTFREVPIYWSSKIQTEISLSTLEAEYIALSQGMRDIVAGISLLLRMKWNLNNISSELKAWEDNTVAQHLANIKDSLKTSRTKHIGIKYHWFISMSEPHTIDIERIDSNKQKVDIFIKGLACFPIERLR